MKIIGITGGVGCGKSTILNILREKYNAGIIITDEIGHLLMMKGEVTYQYLIEKYSNQFLDKDENIDKKKLATFLFNHDSALKEMNNIVHPNVKRIVKEKIKEFTEAGKVHLVVVESALLIEDHYQEFCEEIWYIYTDVEVRRKRLIKTRGYLDEQIDNIIKAQLSESDFRKYCDKVIDNSFSVEYTMKQLHEILAIL